MTATAPSANAAIAVPYAATEPNATSTPPAAGPPTSTIWRTADAAEFARMYSFAGTIAGSSDPDAG